MLYALNGLLVGTLWALWSLTVWAAHAVAAWTLGQAGNLSGQAVGAAVPDWLRLWLPPSWTVELGRWMADLGPWVDSLLQAAPALNGVLTVLAWGVWGLGSVMLLVMGVGLHWLIAVWRRRPPPGNGGHGSPGASLAAR